MNQCIMQKPNLQCNVHVVGQLSGDDGMILDILSPIDCPLIPPRAPGVTARAHCQCHYSPRDTTNNWLVRRRQHV